MTQPGGHCYCGVSEVTSTNSFTCEKCKRQFHADCLKSGLPSILKGDNLFQFKCDKCGDGEEEFERMRLQWMQVVQLALYNLQLSGSGMCGYFRWKEHICAFIDKHWNTFFGSYRKKTSLWHGTVAGVLSSGCPSIFVSGVQELKESGWWRLAVMKPPIVIKQGASVPRPSAKKREIQQSNVEPPKEGLRSRRGKTSIQAAMELKAKRSTLMEAKEIRKSKTQRLSADSMSLPPISIQTSSAHASTSMPLLSAQLQTGRFSSAPNLTSLGTPIPNLTSLGTPIPDAKVPAVPKLSRDIQHTDTKMTHFSGLFSSSQRKSKTPDGGGGSGSTLSLLAEHLTSGSIQGSTPSRQSSLQDCLSDESSEMSQGSYLTEKDLKLPATIPNLLMSDDGAGEDSESDFEIDPGTISPPPTGSPVRMQDSPTVQELLSTMDTASSDPYMAELEDSRHSDSLHGDSFHGDTFQQQTFLRMTSGSGQQSFLMDDSNISQSSVHSIPQYGQCVVRDETDKGGQGDPIDDDGSVVESESESDSDRSDGQTDTVEAEAKKIKLKEEEKEPEQPTIRYHQMSVYEERELLKTLHSASTRKSLSSNVNRLRRKLIVRQQKRQAGIPLFDLDAELNKLAQKCWGSQLGQMEKTGSDKFMNSYNHGDARVLDKYQRATQYMMKTQHQQPSFLNRLVGTEDDQLISIRSPYTARILKPFIRRDSESRPLKMRLLEEIKAYPHRNNQCWKASTPPTIDYCYLRPQHIPSINTLCREFFWPGIDISDCLHYPDFSCVVLFRKIVIGFSFMLPDVKHNEAYISFIFTHPEWRQAGIATFMLYHLIQTCMGKDVTLHVSATNPAMMLYQRFGFKPEEFILDFYDKYYPADSQECKHAFFLRLQR